MYVSVSSLCFKIPDDGHFQSLQLSERSVPAAQPAEGQITQIVSQRLDSIEDARSVFLPIMHLKVQLQQRYQCITRMLLTECSHP